MFPEKTSVAVIGPGAMGSLFAAALAESGVDTWLVDKDPGRADGLAAKGVTILEGEKSRTISVKVTADPDKLRNVDLIILCVKAYDTRAAAEGAQKWTNPDALVMSLQNGAGNVETLVEIFGPDRVVGGTTAQGANLVEPGKVRHAGQGETILGEPGGGTEKASRIAELFTGCGIKTDVTPDLSGLVWSKVAINAAINPLTAILRVKNGALAEIEPARGVMRDICREVSAAVSASGVKLLYDDPFEKAVSVARATSENVSSMLSDVRNKKRTEVDHINGAVVSRAEKAGLEAPVNKAITELVKSIEFGYNLATL